MPSNPAIIPVPNTQKDFYDWTERRQQKLKQVQAGTHDLIFVGDSITHMFEMEGRGQPVWQRSFGNIRTLNLGYGWDCIQNVLWRLENGEFTGQQPKLVVLNIGTNNLTGNDAGRANTADEIVAGIEAICHWIHRQSPASTLLVMSLFPRGLSHEAIHTQVKEVNAALKVSLAGRPRILQLDIGHRLLSPGRVEAEIGGEVSPCRVDVVQEPPVGDQRRR